MVAYIEYDSGEPDDQWYVNEEEKADRGDSVENVVSVQADGEELEAIVNHIKNIPNPPHGMRVVTWWGDDAKFIAQCLPWVRTT